MVDGCHTDRPTDMVIQKFGFSYVSQKKYDLPLETRDGSLLFKILGSVIKPHVMGVANK